MAKIGGLVGKVMEIDEKTRFRHDYVRVKIAYRDITKIPSTTEGALGLFIYDFYFEREVANENVERTLNSGIKVTEHELPPSKEIQI